MLLQVTTLELYGALLITTDVVMVRNKEEFPGYDSRTNKISALYIPSNTRDCRGAQ